MITYVRCRTARQAQEMFEAGLLVVDWDCSIGRTHPQYLPASEVFADDEAGIADKFNGDSVWRRRDFLYIVEE